MFGWGKFGELIVLSIWRISANRLFIVRTKLDSFSLANHGRFTKFTKLSPCQTFLLYSVPYIANSSMWKHFAVVEPNWNLLENIQGSMAIYMIEYHAAIPIIIISLENLHGCCPICKSHETFTPWTISNIWYLKRVYCSHNWPQQYCMCACEQ